MTLRGSDSVLEDRQPEPSGSEGLADARVIGALYQRAKTGSGEKPPLHRRPKRPQWKQDRRAPVRPPSMVDARAPSGG
jgi:hypothetical protein